MRSWLGHKLISYVMERTRRGDIRPTLLLDHPEVWANVDAQIERAATSGSPA